ncbi:MAG: signal peptidase II [Candidatus Babeliales bacterium]|nr:signal peptidase II [Candidatus Babeliales bacterium]
MKKPTILLWSLIIFISTFQLDRVVKQYALDHWTNPQEVNQFLSFQLVFNRGVTGGLFHTENPFWFIILSIFVACIALTLGIYAYMRWRDAGIIFGEALVLSGAFSNLIDRVLFGGVIDFIALSWGDWYFPVFNIADSCIVIGVLIIFFVHLYEPLAK